MVAAEEREVDDLYDELRASDPYHELPRRQLDLVLEMLAGRYADSRVRELVPRVAIDRVDRPRQGAARARRAGSTPRAAPSPTAATSTCGCKGRWPASASSTRSSSGSAASATASCSARRPGASRQITHNDVLVTPAARRGGHGPLLARRGQRRQPSIWRERVGELLAWADTYLAEHARRDAARGARGACAAARRGGRGAGALPGSAARRDRAELPHRRRLLIERVRDPQAPDPRPRLVLHTLWGGQVNRPFAMALAAAWEERFGTRPAGHPRRRRARARAAARAAAATTCSRWSRASGCCRCCAGASRAPASSAPASARTPAARCCCRAATSGTACRCGSTASAASGCSTAVRGFADFPLLLETWRTCLQDEMDLAHSARAARRGRARRDRGRRGGHRARPRPSPPTWGGSRPTS